MPVKRGNELPHAKLDKKTVLAMRKQPYTKTSKQWAAELGVHIRTVDKVRQFLSWSHVR